MTEQKRGKPGSAKRLASELQMALCPITVFGFTLDDEEAFQNWIKRLTEAAKTCDWALFYKLGAGFKSLSTRPPPDINIELRYCLYKAYRFLSRQNANPIEKATVRDLALRIYAVTKEVGTEPDLPLPAYPPKLEKKIAQRISENSTQKWSRHYKAVGLSDLHKSKPGRKGAKK
jgi:hypothetical protein